MQHECKNICSIAAGENVMIHSESYPGNGGTGPYSASASRRRARYRGIALVWAALVTFTLFLFVGLSLDMAKLCLVNHQMHNAADAAALAGAPWVKKDRDKARLLAYDFALKNKADGVDVYLDPNPDNLAYGDIIIGRYTYNPDDHKSYFFRYDPSALNPIPINALAVSVARTQQRVDAGGAIPLFFGPLVSVFTADLEGSCEIRDPDTYAIVSNPNTGLTPRKHGPYAIAVAVGGQGSGLVCLRHDLTGLHIQGTSTLTVNNITDPPVYEEGAIWINSNDDELSLYTNGTSTEINADIINIAADDLTIKGNFVFPPEPDMYLNFRQPPIPDPLWWLNEPGYKPTDPALGYMVPSSVPGYRITSSGGIPKDENGVITPIPSGYYPDGLYLSAGTEANPIRLGSGVYVLDGVGLEVMGSAVVVADPGCFFYITGTGECYIHSGTKFTATPMTSGLYEGIIIAQDKLDLEGATVYGGPGFNLEGTMYFPQHVVDQSNAQAKTFALSVGGTGAAFNNQIIADSIYIPGNSNVTVNYDGRNPAPVSRAYLVE